MKSLKTDGQIIRKAHLSFQISRAKNMYSLKKISYRMYSDQFTALMNTLFIRKYLPVPLVQNIFLLIEEKIIASSITLHICT